MLLVIQKALFSYSLPLMHVSLFSICNTASRTQRCLHWSAGMRVCVSRLSPRERYPESPDWFQPLQVIQEYGVYIFAIYLPSPLNNGSPARIVASTDIIAGITIGFPTTDQVAASSSQTPSSQCSAVSASQMSAGDSFAAVPKME